MQPTTSWDDTAPFRLTHIPLVTNSVRLSLNPKHAEFFKELFQSLNTAIRWADSLPELQGCLVENLISCLRFEEEARKSRYLNEIGDALSSHPEDTLARRLRILWKVQEFADDEAGQSTPVRLIEIDPKEPQLLEPRKWVFNSLRHLDYITENESPENRPSIQAALKRLTSREIRQRHLEECCNQFKNKTVPIKNDPNVFDSSLPANAIAWEKLALERLEIRFDEIFSVDPPLDSPGTLLIDLTYRLAYFEFSLSAMILRFFYPGMQEEYNKSVDQPYEEVHAKLDKWKGGGFEFSPSFEWRQFHNNLLFLLEGAHDLLESFQKRKAMGHSENFTLPQPLAPSTNLSAGLTVSSRRHKRTTSGKTSPEGKSDSRAAKSNPSVEKARDETNRILNQVITILDRGITLLEEVKQALQEALGPSLSSSPPQLILNLESSPASSPRLNLESLYFFDFSHPLALTFSSFLIELLQQMESILEELAEIHDPERPIKPLQSYYRSLQKKEQMQNKFIFSELRQLMDKFHDNHFELYNQDQERYLDLMAIEIWEFQRKNQLGGHKTKGHRTLPLLNDKLQEAVPDRELEKLVNTIYFQKRVEFVNAASLKEYLKLHSLRTLLKIHLGEEAIQGEGNGPVPRVIAGMLKLYREKYEKLIEKYPLKDSALNTVHLKELQVMEVHLFGELYPLIQKFKDISKRSGCFIPPPKGGSEIGRPKDKNSPKMGGSEILRPRNQNLNDLLTTIQKAFETNSFENLPSHEKVEKDWQDLEKKGQTPDLKRGVVRVELQALPPQMIQVGNHLTQVLQASSIKLAKEALTKSHRDPKLTAYHPDFEEKKKLLGKIIEVLPKVADVVFRLPLQQEKQRKGSFLGLLF